MIRYARKVRAGRGFVPGQPEALRGARRDTAVTVESAWCSALAVRVAGLRCSAARASRWTITRASGNAMASSIKRRSLRKTNHMISVPSCGRDNGLSCPRPVFAIRNVSVLMQAAATRSGAP